MSAEHLPVVAGLPLLLNLLHIPNLSTRKTFNRPSHSLPISAASATGPASTGQLPKTRTSAHLNTPGYMVPETV